MRTMETMETAKGIMWVNCDSCKNAVSIKLTPDVLSCCVNVILKELSSR